MMLSNFDSNVRGLNRSAGPIVAMIFGLLFLITPLRADDAPPSNVGPLIGLMKKGALPAERLPGVVKVVCERGNEHDLAFVFSEVVREDHWDRSLRGDTIGWLYEAATSRKVRPAGDVSAIATLVQNSSEPKLQLPAMKLIGLWKVTSAAAGLEAIIESDKSTDAARSAAIDAVVALGGEVAARAVDTMLRSDQPLSVQFRGVAAQTTIDIKQAATSAAKVLKSAGSEDDPALLMNAFLQQKGGADVLAKALESTPPNADVALLLLRQMYAVGHSDAVLDKVLSKLAGVNDVPPKPTEARIKELALQADTEGDAIRGELVFRRADLACMKCHAVSKAGGRIGPDLSAVGASSPVDYLVKSILDPDAQKKEEYVTRVIVDSNGGQLIGIIENRTADKLTLKTADGKHVSIALADIEFEGEGVSLMPEGLVRFMTERELLDVVKFLSQLGKPGTEYAIRTTQRMQRWRSLEAGLDRFQGEVPNEEFFGDLILSATGWQSFYAMTNGNVPLKEATQRAKFPILYLQGEIEVTEGGEVVVQVDDPAGLTLWVEETSLDLNGPRSLAVEPGRHRITLRVDTTARPRESLKLEVAKGTGSTVEFTVVDGA